MWGTSGTELLLLVGRDKPDRFREALAGIGIADRELVRRAPVLAPLDAHADPGIDAVIQEQRLRALNERLGTHLDRYLFDQGTDAARAWQFAVLWPAALLEHHAELLGVQSHVRATVTEPAWACLRRCVG